jgi:hypothetical protein
MTIIENPLYKPAALQEEIRTPITREDLYALVWSEPMLKVAAKFDVSSSYMARVCTRMNIPRPERGYWAKFKAGKSKLQIPLSEPQPGNELVWSREGSSLAVPRPLPKPPVHMKRKPPIPQLHMNQHPLINGAKPLFESGGLSYEGGYLKPVKKLLVDLVVTKTGLDKALSFANLLFLSLERKGHRVVIAPYSEHLRREEVDERAKPDKAHRYDNLWSPLRNTVVYVGTVAIGLTIIEISEEVEVRYINGEYVPEKDYVSSKLGRNSSVHSWATKKYFPTGRLCLQAYSPYPMAKWKCNWVEKNTVRNLDHQVKEIAKKIEQSAIEIAQLVEEGMRQAEIERQRWEVQKREWEQKDAERRAAMALKESKDDLRNIIDRWAESNRIEQFFAEAERKSADLEEEKRFKLLDRIRHARELIGKVDALDYFFAWRSPDER